MEPTGKRNKSVGISKRAVGNRVVARNNMRSRSETRGRDLDVDLDLGLNLDMDDFVQINQEWNYLAVNECEVTVPKLPEPKREAPEEIMEAKPEPEPEPEKNHGETFYDPCSNDEKCWGEPGLAGLDQREPLRKEGYGTVDEIARERDEWTERQQSYSESEEGDENWYWDKRESPSALRGLCQLYNGNQKLETTLERWEQKYDPRHLSRWEKDGYRSEAEMGRAIIGDIKNGPMGRSMSSLSETRWKFETPGWTVRRDGGEEHYPMERARGYIPYIERDMSGALGPSGRGPRTYKMWAGGLHWYRLTQLGPRQQVDGDGRRLVSLFIQPRGNHFCETYLFSRCWSCWDTGCKTCYFMFASGAQHWGPGVCDECPNFNAHDREEETARWRTVYGSSTGDQRPSTITWVIVYDKLHKRADDIFIHRKGSCWTPTEIPLPGGADYTYRSDDYDNVTDDESPYYRPRMRPQVKGSGNTPADATAAGGEEPVGPADGARSAGGQHPDAGPDATNPDGGNTSQEATDVGPAGAGEADLAEAIDNITIQSHAGGACIEERKEFRELVGQYADTCGTTGGKQDEWGAPEDSWNEPLVWAGECEKHLPFPESHQALGGMLPRNGSNGAPTAKMDILGRILRDLDVVDLGGDVKVVYPKGTSGPLGHMDPMVSGGGDLLMAAGASAGMDMGSSGERPSNADVHATQDRPGQEAHVPIQDDMEHGEDGIALSRFASRRTDNRRRRRRAAAAKLDRSVSLEQDGGGARRRQEQPQKRIRDDTPRPKAGSKRKRPDREPKLVVFRDPSTDRERTHDPTRERGYYTDSYRRNGGRR